MVGCGAWQATVNSSGVHHITVGRLLPVLCSEARRRPAQAWLQVINEKMKIARLCLRRPGWPAVLLSALPSVPWCHQYCRLRKAHCVRLSVSSEPFYTAVPSVPRLLPHYLPFSTLLSSCYGPGTGLGAGNTAMSHPNLPAFGSPKLWWERQQSANEHVSAPVSI